MHLASQNTYLYLALIHQGRTVVCPSNGLIGEKLKNFVRYKNRMIMKLFLMEKLATLFDHNLSNSVSHIENMNYV